MDDKITAHERSYLKKCLELDRALLEVAAARAMRDDINCYNAGISLLVEYKFKPFVDAYYAIRKDNEEQGL